MFPVLKPIDWCSKFNMIILIPKFNLLTNQPANLRQKSFSSINFRHDGPSIKNQKKKKIPAGFDFKLTAPTPNVCTGKKPLAEVFTET